MPAGAQHMFSGQDVVLVWTGKAGRSGPDSVNLLQLWNCSKINRILLWTLQVHWDALQITQDLVEPQNHPDWKRPSRFKSNMYLRIPISDLWNPITKPQCHIHNPTILLTYASSLPSWRSLPEGTEIGGHWPNKTRLILNWFTDLVHCTAMSPNAGPAGYKNEQRVGLPLQALPLHFSTFKKQTDLATKERFT